MEIKDLLGDAFKEGMTMEELTTALKDISLPEDQSGEIARLKDTISKSNSEAKEWKDKYRATLDESTRKAQETEEATKKMQERLMELEKEKTVSGYKANYLAMGYEPSLAEETAQAIVDGNMAKVFENQKKHQETVEKKAREEALRGSPRPGGSGGEDRPDDDEASRIIKRINESRLQSDKAAMDGLKAYLR